MYSQRVIQKNIDLALSTGHITSPPHYYSCSEVKEWIAHLNTTRAIDDKGRITVLRPFTAEEITFIRGERFLCRNDFSYFSTRYCWIKSAADELIQFSPWAAQSIFLDILAEMEDADLAIMLQILKARQLGISRIISIVILHRVIFFPLVNAIIASSTPDKTRLLADMLYFVFERLPFWLVPEITAQRVGEFIEFGNMDSGLTLQHGSQLTGIARGTTPTIGHLTELAEFDNPAKIVDSALLRAMHDSPRILLALEGTAEGQYDWWHNTWTLSKNGYASGRSRLRPLFLPWMVGTDLYPTETWLRAHPVPPSYQPAPFVIDHAQRASDYVMSNSLLRKYLWESPNPIIQRKFTPSKDLSRWTMPVEQQWFYEVERGIAVAKGILNKFLGEMPASDDEAFQSKNQSVFTTEILTMYRDNTKPPIGVYGLIGPVDLVPPRLVPHPSEINPHLPSIPITTQWGNADPVQYSLVPLRWDGYPTDSGLNKIYIWEHPQPDEIYGLGIDTADGVKRDRTVIQILRKGSLYRAAAQVGEFASDIINAIDTLPFAMALATYFSPDGSNLDHLIDTDIDDQFLRRQCRVAIECVRNGDQLQHKMRLQGWRNFHPWQRIDNKQLDQSQYNKIGIHTNSWFRTGLMEFMLKMIRDMELDIRSPFFVGEMGALEASDEVTSLRAAHGHHDDLFLAMGFIVISLYQHEKGRNVAVQNNSGSNGRPALKRPDVARVYARSPRTLQDAKRFL